ncbi:zinc finger protein 729-like [Trichogramma pretiosum]|uniref:zinc finger protein 729-like n=1 Tax=Trichogramma pretiosum TaxID=7493 RepID=UPI0006C95218|nr:zinc finger protein 729-like [Trichogramma pretiosum]
MEITEDAVRVKEEPNDTCPDADDDYNFDLVNSYEAKNIETLPFHELSYNDVNVAGHLKLDENILINCECKNVKVKLPSLLTTICKSKHSLPMKGENQNQTTYLDGKSPIVLIKKDFNYHKKNIQPKLSYEYKRETSLNTLVSLFREKIRPYENEICYKSFAYKSSHSRTKPFECEELFKQNSDLKHHMNAVHEPKELFECEICQKSFGQKPILNRHINAVHNRIEPFECDICQKSFDYQSVLKRHVNAVHDHSKPFESEICHKSFGQKCNLNRHITTLLRNTSTFQFISEN